MLLTIHMELLNSLRNYCSVYYPKARTPVVWHPSALGSKMGPKMSYRSELSN